MRTKTLESTIFYLFFFSFLFWLIWEGILWTFGTATDNWLHIKRNNVCITAFSYQRLIFGTSERGNGRNLFGIGYPKGVDPTTPRLPTTTICLSFEFSFLSALS